MGTWGAGIFECDLANDVREEFLGELRLGKSAEAATRKLEQLRAQEIADSDDGPVFWLALSETQWDVGRLLDEVRVAALEILANPIDPEHWGELFQARMDEQERLVGKLKSPQPKKKRIRRWKPKLRAGDVFTIDLPNGATVYGRVLVVFPPEGGFPEHAWAAYYALDGIEQAMRDKRMKLSEGGASWEEIGQIEFEMEDIVNMDIGVISHYPSEFDTPQPKVIGHLPLENRFKNPIFFYQRHADGNCRVFDLFNRRSGGIVPFSKVPVGIPRWNDFGLEETLLRLGVRN